MTFDEFQVDFCAFLEDSTVNLGRKTAKTRQAFISAAMAKFDAFLSEPEQMIDPEPKQLTGSANDRVLCIKPKDSRKALDIGKGVHAMTPSESMRADEQLNRSPFGSKTNKNGKKK